MQNFGALRAIDIVSTETSKMEAVTTNLRPKSSESKLIPMKGSNTREKKFKGTVNKKMMKNNKAVPKKAKVLSNHIKNEFKASGTIIKGTAKKEKAVSKMKISPPSIESRPKEQC